MKKSAPATIKEVDRTSEKLVKISLYVLFVVPIYSMFFGFKMSNMLGAGKEIPSLLKAAHVHSVLIAIVLLFLVYDWRLKEIEYAARIGRKFSAIMIAASVAGLVLLTAGFTVAGLYPQYIPLGLDLAKTGEIIMFLAVLSYVLTAIIEEMYK